MKEIVARLNKYRCKHGVLGFCEYCWAEGFRERWKDPEFPAKVVENPDAKEAFEEALDKVIKKKKSPKTFLTKPAT